MTLADALALCRERARDMTLSDTGRQWHARLADWLGELKYRREMERCRTGKACALPSTNC